MRRVEVRGKILYPDIDPIESFVYRRYGLYRKDDFDYFTDKRVEIPRNLRWIQEVGENLSSIHIAAFEVQLGVLSTQLLYAERF
ncbi:MAG: hypothetical protein EZS28_009715 [Streblomastix strix]|uniref:Uncharacterized protein n=1 Tax=Streblomastix strix TaxID=222440 RepID=A0A5J4WJP6_9EUKA|nr:MAG: hypothetical protein EZS28_009715 [Streblomastix strix]